MNIFLIGGGGREHALAWKLSQSPLVEKLYATPGNPGIAAVAQCLPRGDGSPKTLLAAADAIGADLTVVGPEEPLVKGIVDVFRAAGRRIVGPASQAAQLEGSKIFAKDFLDRHHIPTAEFITVANRQDAQRAISRFGFPVVLKADGLASGKGVIIVQDSQEADRALDTLGSRLVVEEFLRGEEVSFIALCDGKDVLPLAPTQDHKAIYDGDQGPNTGGMGAYCDSRILTPAETAHVLDTIIQPTVAAHAFTGFLYAGLMMTEAGPKVLEFNVRLGDPETQPLMHRMASDFVPALLAAAEGNLAGSTLEWREGPSVCVVLASGGYPGTFPTGFPISGIDRAEQHGAVVFHAGTRSTARALETAGGRVLGVTASGDGLATAIENTYAAVREIHFEGLHCRSDIGNKGLSRYNGIGLGT